MCIQDNLIKNNAIKRGHLTPNSHKQPIFKKIFPPDFLGDKIIKTGTQQR